MRKSRSVGALFCLLILATSVQAAQGIVAERFLMKSGDDPAWSRPDLDDSDWLPIEFSDVPGLDSVVWLRTLVRIGPENLSEGRPLGIYIAALASHEIWWDGQRIGRGGLVGASPEQERPGPIDAHYVIPDRLAAVGEHTLAIRTSAFHRHFRPSTGYWSVYIAEYDRMVISRRTHLRIALVSLSGMVMMAIFALMMFTLDVRDRSFLFLGLLCLTAALLLIVESWRSLVDYTYNWHLLRLVLVTALSWLVDVLLLVFLARRFPMSGARWFVLAGVAGATVPIFVNRGWDPKAVYGFLIVFSLCTLWGLRAVTRRLPGSLPATAGLSFCLALLLWAPFRFPDRYLYPALDVLLICLLVSHVLQVGRERREREEALLKSARLEIELLRKHIQPHFLMNTLTALSEWIEQEPKVATSMIQSLSEEFRMLSEISDRRLIRMEDEIRLCRIHLEIMSRRKGREYRMTTDGVDPDAQIPPAVIHTLLENAITHNHHREQNVEFRLREQRQDGRRRYVFTSRLTSPPQDGGAREGTGLRYIRARLQESFGTDWKLETGPAGPDWRTEITVPAGG